MKSTLLYPALASSQQLFSWDCPFNGFMQLIFKATRVQGSSYGLIDHIMSNVQLNEFSSGVIISDISDHFLTFVVDKNIIDPKKSEFISSPTFSLHQVNRFKETLQNVNWGSVINQQNVNLAYDNFWNTFSQHYENCFPLRRVKRNKNIHPINKFMTPGLITSRNTKNNA